MPNLKRQLSSRLQFIFDKLLPGLDVWDICCDHGYLGIKAYSCGLFKHIHFVDQVEHLMAPLRSQFKGIESASFYVTPAQELKMSLSGNVVIAGVGAELIIKILSSLANGGFLKAERVILVPHKDSEKLQEWLCQDSVFSKLYKLTEVAIVDERGRKREVFTYTVYE